MKIWFLLKIKAWEQNICHVTMCDETMKQQLFCFKEWCKVCLWCLFLYIQFLNNSSKNSVCHGVAKNLNFEQMIIKSYKLSKHRTINLFCLKTRLQCIRLKLGACVTRPICSFFLIFPVSFQFLKNSGQTPAKLKKEITAALAPSLTCLKNQ